MCNVSGTFQLSKCEKYIIISVSESGWLVGLRLMTLSTQTGYKIYCVEPGTRQTQ